MKAAIKFEEMAKNHVRREDVAVEEAAKTDLDPPGLASSPWRTALLPPTSLMCRKQALAPRYMRNIPMTYFASSPRECCREH